MSAETIAALMRVREAFVAARLQARDRVGDDNERWYQHGFDVGLEWSIGEIDAAIARAKGEAER
ncbi:MAG: hypothetical protein GEU73_06160 [Chloroflexi bacterium]|nr:hypothetical protein [Chloroflexota bacterium]